MRDWSYYGAAHRYDIHDGPDAERRCEQAMRDLRGGDEAELRREIDAGQDVMWLVHHLSDLGRVDDALGTLRGWSEQHPDLGRLADARRFDLLLAHGRDEEVRRAATSGNEMAIRRLRRPPSTSL